MKREFQAFAESPTRSNYLAAFHALRAQSRRSLSSEDVAHLLTLLEAGAGHEMADAIASLPPIAALSPAVHSIAAQGAKAAGDAQDWELEQFLLDTCLSAILESGNGTAESPYVVTCGMDERHVCQVLGLAPSSQALINHHGKSLDVIQCASGLSLFFDVSAAIPLPAPQPLRRGERKKSASIREPRCRQSRGKRLSQTPR